MGLATNVLRRKGTYWFRVRVPKDLVRRAGRREIWKSLKTSNPTVARQRASVVWGPLPAFWDTIRNDMSLTQVEIDQLVVEYFHSLLEDDEKLWGLDRNSFSQNAKTILRAAVAYPRTDVPEAEIDAAIAASGKSEIDLLWDRWSVITHNEAKEAVRQRDWADASLLAQQLLKEKGIDLEFGSPEFQRLCIGILRAVVEASGIKIERSNGNYGTEPKDALFRQPPLGSVIQIAPPPTATASPPPPAASLSSLVEKLLGEKKGITPKFADDHRAAVRTFEQTLKRPDRWHEATRRDVAHFKDLLLQAPANWTKLYKGKPLPEVVELAAKSDKPRLAPRTVNDKYLSLLSAVLKWTVTNGYIESNPAQGVKVEQAKGAKRKKPRTSFTSDHLKRMFSAPLFVGCKSDRSTTEPGSHRVRDHRFWAPLIALLAGARLNEIGQLTSDDVREVDGVLCFRITDSEEDGRHLKTEAAKRVVPVHPELVKLGLPVYLSGIRAKGPGRLFPKWQKGEDGYYSSVFSKWFARFMDSVDLRDKKLVFHSFRHSFIDALRAADVQKSLRAALVGHEEGDVEGGYGVGYPARTLLVAVEKVGYHGLDLSRLYPR